MRSPQSVKAWLHDVARCHVEIAEIEHELRRGHRDMDGLLAALSDWAAELRILNGTTRTAIAADRAQDHARESRQAQFEQT